MNRSIGAVAMMAALMSGAACAVEVSAPVFLRVPATRMVSHLRLPGRVQWQSVRAEWSALLGNRPPAAGATATTVSSVSSPTPLPRGRRAASSSLPLVVAAGRRVSLQPIPQAPVHLPDADRAITPAAPHAGAASLSASVPEMWAMLGVVALLIIHQLRRSLRVVRDQSVFA